MKVVCAETYRSPCCAQPLKLRDACPRDASEIEMGWLVCQHCGKDYPVSGRIPRFASRNNSDDYTANFGFQWTRFDQTLLDSYNGTDTSAARLFAVTSWPRDLIGQTVLEAGSGMGRFTEVIAKTGATVFTFDYSSAIDANARNNGHFPNVHFSQADIFHIPFPEKTFDKIICFGMLQHTPDPERAFQSMVAHLKEGGQIAVDVYDLTFRALVNLKYWLRPFTKRLPHGTLFRALQALVPRVFPVKMWLTDHFPYGKYLAFFIPISYHKGFIPQADKLTYNQLIEWSILDSFDKYSCVYDKPQTLRTVRRWFRDAGLVNAQVRCGPNGIVGCGTKPHR